LQNYGVINFVRFFGPPYSAMPPGEHSGKK